jgi:fatty-acid peroxygenase
VRSYDVPPQDLTVSLARVPALPASRFIIENVRLRT